MKFLYLVIISCIFFLFSCKKGEDNIINEYNFRLELSNGLQITEKNILFYDSSTHFLFLKTEVDLTRSFSSFSVWVNLDTIYSGKLHRCILSSHPKSTFFLNDCSFYGQKIVELGYYPYSPDLRNDRKVIEAFKESKLLRSGISCSIDSIRVKNFDNHSEVSCKITLTNHDLSDYYIIDPQKMGELDFNYYTGGLLFQNSDTKTSSFLRWSVSSPDYWKLSVDDLSVLKGKSKVSYTFKSSDYYKIGKGLNKVIFRFGGWNSNNSEINLTRNNGRVWVGRVMAVDSVLVE